MEIKIKQPEVIEAVKAYIKGLISIHPHSDINVDFTYTRGADGLVACIDIVPASAKVEQEPVVVDEAPAETVDEPIPPQAVQRTTQRKVQLAESKPVVTEEEKVKDDPSMETKSVAEQPGGFPNPYGDGSETDPADENAAGRELDPVEQDSGPEVQDTAAETEPEEQKEPEATPARKSLFGGLKQVKN